jgi:hypothetical protein
MIGVDQLSARNAARHNHPLFRLAQSLRTLSEKRPSDGASVLLAPPLIFPDP